MKSEVLSAVVGEPGLGSKCPGRSLSAERLADVLQGALRFVRPPPVEVAKSRIVSQSIDDGTVRHELVLEKELFQRDQLKHGGPIREATELSEFETSKAGQPSHRGQCLQLGETVEAQDFQSVQGGDRSRIAEPSHLIDD